MVSSGDLFSARKAVEFERDHPKGSSGTYTVNEIPRARKIGQSWLTTPISCSMCFVGCMRTVGRRGRRVPDVVITNGPGSAVLLVLVCLVYKVCVGFLPLLSHVDVVEFPDSGDMVVTVLWVISNKNDIRGIIRQSQQIITIWKDTLSGCRSIHRPMAKVGGEISKGRVPRHFGIISTIAFRALVARPPASRKRINTSMLVPLL